MYIEIKLLADNRLVINDNSVSLNIVPPYLPPNIDWSIKFNVEDISAKPNLGAVIDLIESSKIKTLNLGNLFFNEEETIRLAKAINNNNIYQLFVGDNFNLEQSKYLYDQLSNNSCIRYINIKNEHIFESLEEFSRMILADNLIELVSIINQKIDNTKLSDMFKAIKYADKFHGLLFKKCDLSLNIDEAAEDLPDFKLDFLSFIQSKLNYVSVNYLTEIINKNSLQGLDLTNCNINENDLSVLLNPNNGINVKILSLINNNLTEGSFALIGEYVKTHNQLSLLALRNNIVTNKSAIIIKDFLSNNTGLNDLVLTNSKINDDFFKIIAEGMFKSELKFINVEGNEITAASSDIVGKIIKDNKLESVYIGENHHHFIEALENFQSNSFLSDFNNATLKNYYYDNYDFLKLLSTKLQNNYSLTHIDLKSRNYMSYHDYPEKYKSPEYDNVKALHNEINMYFSRNNDIADRLVEFFHSNYDSVKKALNLNLSENQTTLPEELKLLINNAIGYHLIAGRTNEYYLFQEELIKFIEVNFPENIALDKYNWVNRDNEKINLSNFYFSPDEVNNEDVNVFCDTIRPNTDSNSLNNINQSHNELCNETQSYGYDSIILDLVSHDEGNFVEELSGSLNESSFS